MPKLYKRDSFNLLFCRGNSLHFAGGGWNCNNNLATNKDKSLEKKNIELSDFIRYLDSESYAEKKARTELGLKSPDEKVIIVPKGSEEKIDAVDSPELQNNVPKVPESNMVKWWRYFFSKNKKYDS